MPRGRKKASQPQKKKNYIYILVLYGMFRWRCSGTREQKNMNRDDFSIILRTEQFELCLFIKHSVWLFLKHTGNVRTWYPSSVFLSQFLILPRCHSSSTTGTVSYNSNTFRKLCEKKGEPGILYKHGLAGFIPEKTSYRVISCSGNSCFLHRCSVTG